MESTQPSAPKDGDLTERGDEDASTRAGPPPTTWTVHRIEATDCDKTVLSIGPPRRPPVLLRKLTSTDSAMMSFRQQEHVLAILHTNRRPGEWRALVPTLLAVGEIEGQAYMVELLLGRDMAGVLYSPAACARMQIGTAAALGELHRCTVASVLPSSDETIQSRT